MCKIKGKITVTCLLFGHKISDTTDSGYMICERCNMHSGYDNKYYYDNKWPYWQSDGILVRPFYRAKYWLKKQIHNSKIKERHRRCDECGWHSKNKLWKNDVCPVCKETNLPF